MVVRPRRAGFEGSARGFDWEFVSGRWEIGRGSNHISFVSTSRLGRPMESYVATCTMTWYRS